MAREILRVTTTYLGVSARFLETLTPYLGVNKGACHPDLDAEKVIRRPKTYVVGYSLMKFSTTYSEVRNLVLWGKHHVPGGKKPRTSGLDTTYLGVRKCVPGGKKPRTSGVSLAQNSLQNLEFLAFLRILLVSCIVFVYVVLLATGFASNSMYPYQGRTYG